MFFQAKPGMLKLIFRNALFPCAALIVLCTFLSCGGVKDADKPNEQEMAQYPEKKEMILLTDRPPQLETPLRIFREDITPNDYFFVRWHMSQLVTKIDIDTFRLYIGGAVGRPLALSMNDLKTKFTPDSVVALAICAGNSRATFKPKVPGLQWNNGSMGNAKWKGVRLKDILAMAGVKKGAMEVTFQGLDRGALPDIPAFIKSLDIDHSMDGEVLIAYEMNGQPLPMLNGYPLKLVVPGWYASYWVGSLANINVLTDTFKGFWMKSAYRIPSTGFDETPDSLAKVTVPISNINLHSIFVEPDTSETVVAHKPCLVEGLAYNDGTGIKKVELSFDDGKQWVDAPLNPEIGKYSWRRWKYTWTPEAKGVYHLKVRATDNKGRVQTDKQWNRSGYARGFIERLEVNVD